MDDLIGLVQHRVLVSTPALSLEVVDVVAPLGRVVVEVPIPSGRKAPETTPIPAAYSNSVSSSIVGRAETPKKRTNSHAILSESSPSS